MKHIWKNDHMTNALVMSTCIRCRCRRFTQHSKQRGIYNTSYQEEGKDFQVRTAPVCVDKINPEIDFDTPNPIHESMTGDLGLLP